MILVVGGSGFLGAALRATAPGPEMLFTYFTHPLAGGARLDARAGVRELVRTLPGRVSAALILAGTTNVDACARDPDGTAQLNVVAIKRIIDELRELRIAPVFTSSDAVFDGSRGYWKEDDPVSPVLTYGRQKREVERYLLSMPAPGLVVRLPKLISAIHDSRCMVGGWIEALGRPEVMLCATDNFFSPADAGDAARAILTLVKAGATGLYHVGGGERIGRRELLRVVEDEYRLRAAPKATIRECSLRDVPVLEPRPLDTSMDSSKYVALAGRALRSASEVARLAVRSHFGGSP